MGHCTEDKTAEKAFDRIMERLDAFSFRMDQLENSIAKIKSEVPETIAHRPRPISREQANTEILEAFNFENVANVMKFLDWKWAPSADTPTSQDIKKSAKELLDTAWKDLDMEDFNAEGWREWFVATGGLEVWVCEGNESQEYQRMATLKFVIEEWRVD